MTVRYAAWRSAAAVVVREDEVIIWNLSESGDPNVRPSAEDLQPLSTARRDELEARRRLNDEVARELRHR